MAIPASPYRTSSRTGSFRPYSDGVMQGMADADPASQNWLNMGMFDPTASSIAFGGLPIIEHPFQGNLSANKPTLDLATAATVADISGFSVFDQGHHGVITPGASNVPSFYPGMDLPFYRLNTNARIPVQCSPSLISLVGGSISPTVGWDFDAGMLVPVTAGTPVAISSAAWADGIVTFTTGTAHGLAAGEDVTIAGFTPAGYNGQFEVISVPTAGTFTVVLASDPGAVTTAGTVATVAGTGTLNVKVLSVHINSQVVITNPATGVTSWQDGTAAIIQI